LSASAAKKSSKTLVVCLVYLQAMTATDLIFLTLGIFAGLGLMWLLLRRQTRLPGDAMADIQRHVLDRLDNVTRQIDARLHENVRAMNESKAFLSDRVSSTERTVREVSASLGRLEQATGALRATTDEISNFQNLLRSPKVRGSFGEVLLNNLLGDILPQDRYAVQHTLASTGEIADAVIKLQDGYMVAIDAKFPLANYEIYAREKDKEKKSRSRSAVMRDIKKHVLDISNKYISPKDNTLDYAFMYIPVEGVYYETMVQPADDDSLWDYCLRHHVVPVSPNSFLAYLQTVLIGLRGMKIEQQAREILHVRALAETESAD
jgi:DNA recombination protein RmuC